MPDLAQVLAALDLRATGETSFETGHIDTGHGVVFGGQLLAQSVVAASRVVADKELMTLHTVFARGANFAEPLAIGVHVAQNGRSFATASVTITQSRGTCVESLALLQHPDDELIAHSDAMPGDVGEPDDHAPLGHEEFWDARIVGDVDISDPALTGPAALRVWSRFPGAPSDLATAQALLAYASDGWLIATAMRPHAGVGQAMAHVSISTTVLAQTIRFHEGFSADEWLLLDQHSTYAGRGRSHGAANVFKQDGRLVASFTQDNMIRNMPEAQRPADGDRARF